MSDTNVIRHNGFWSLCPLLAPIAYITTTENNQTYTILDEDGRRLYLNSINFVSIDSPLYIRINDNKNLLPIQTANIIEYNYQSVYKFTVMNAFGTKFMAYGLYY